MIHALTIDVEDYHNIIARDWLGRDFPPTRAVVENTRRLLARFAAHGVRGTFFTLGEVAVTHPDLVREIAAGGHELGVHGFYHRQVFKLTPESFRREVVDAKRAIEDLTGTAVRGHRAPAFSIMPETRWALDVLAEAGFEYDSSVFPIRGRRYGWPGFRRDIHVLRTDGGRSLVEVPLSTVGIGGLRIPVCGGGYMRHFPGFVSRWALRAVQRERPAVIYTHPYEIEVDPPDPDFAALRGRARRRLRIMHWLQKRNRCSVIGKIESLLTRFQFAPLGEIIDGPASLSARG